MLINVVDPARHILLFKRIPPDFLTRDRSYFLSPLLI
jgi:hypothetical protein